MRRVVPGPGVCNRTHGSMAQPPVSDTGIREPVAGALRLRSGLFSEAHPEDTAEEAIRRQTLPARHRDAVGSVTRCFVATQQMAV